MVGYPSGGRISALPGAPSGAATSGGIHHSTPHRHDGCVERRYAGGPVTSGKKFGWGIGLSSVGSLLFLGGLALSFTIIGACLGIPFMFIGFPLMIWGAVWTYQARSQAAAEMIAAGIRSGMADSRQDARRAGRRPPPGDPSSTARVDSGASPALSIAPEPAAPSPLPAPGLLCSQCGSSYPVSFKFCTEDGTPLRAVQSVSEGAPGRPA